jgi:hypothetical protein
MSKSIETTTRALRVKGHLWMGRDSEYEYPIGKDEQVNFLSCAKRRASDFESISSAVIVTTKTITTITTKKLKP